jgi:site-specific recombinase XerC
MKNKAYRAFPLGQEAGAYLRQNRGRILPNTYATYESCLDKFARFFADLELSDFEPPVGTERLEEFIDEEWGERSARTRAKNISILKGFFEWAVLRQKLHGDPSRPIKPPKKRGVERTTFSPDQERAIFAQNDRRDCLALHLLLKCGLRKSALRHVQFRHFDHAQRRLTIFTKGGKVQTIPIVDPAFWNDLERWILDWEAQPDNYLLCRRTVRPNRHKPGREVHRRAPRRADGRPRATRLVVQLPRMCRRGRARPDARRADAQSPPHRRTTGPRSHAREPKGDAEAARPLVDLDDR